MGLESAEDKCQKYERRLEQRCKASGMRGVWLQGVWRVSPDNYAAYAARCAQWSGCMATCGSSRRIVDAHRFHTGVDEHDEPLSIHRS